MDPLPVIGLAVMVLQFIQYATKACQIVKEFCADDRRVFYEGLFVNLAKHFLAFTKRFEDQRNFGSSPAYSPFTVGHRSMDADIPVIAGHTAHITQTQLLQLTERFYNVSVKLTHNLSRIAIDKVVENNNVRIAERVQAVREYWNQLEIDHFLATLENSHKPFAKEALACISTCMSDGELSNRFAFGNDYGGGGRIVEILAFAEDLSNPHSHTSEQKLRDDMQTVASDESVSSSSPKNVMAAVVKFQNGGIEYFTESGINAYDIQGKHQIYYSLRDPDLTTTIDSFEHIQDLVLDSLYFRQFYERFKTVRVAHEKTYEWIFCPPEAKKPWAPFVDWLEHGSGCYYISGKPGSGKSTLMKFTAPHKRTKSALDKWAPIALVRASLFFWNLGSPLQKSSIGLLRGLLYDLLRQQRGLISVVMPELCHRATYLAKGSNLGEASEEDLGRWLRKLLAETTTSLKFFIVIDGLDEFEGIHDDLVQLITDVVKNKNVKVLVSSRPTELSEDSFQACPQLRLDDLTRGDIEKYAGDHLSGRLERKHGAEWAEVITEITDRSQGVFLWVVLVVQSLKDGLREGDNIKEIGDRLNALPNDLKTLYDHILKRFKLKYPRQASQMFQLLLQAQQVQSSAGYPLLIQLSFCDEDPERVITLPIGPLDPGYYIDNCEQFSSRIRSRSGGLIESREWQTNRISGVNQTVVTSMYVDFIHRTVVEFLRLPGVWEDLLALTATPKKYDPSPQLFRSCVIMCKTLPAPRGIDTEISVIWHMMDRALVFASMAEDSGEPVDPQHLKQLDTVLTKHWSESMKCFSRKGSCDTEGHWARGYTVDPQRQHVLDPDDFASVALFHGLEHYLTDELANSVAVAVMDTTRLLFNSLQYIGAPPWDKEEVEFDGSLTSEAALFLTRKTVMRPRWVRIGIRLLEAEGTNPNKPISGRTSAWELMLSYVAIIAKTQRVKQSFHRNLGSEEFGSLFARLLDKFIKQGADLHFCIEAGAEPAGKLVQQLFSVESGSSARIDPWAPQPAVPTDNNLTVMRDYFRDLIAERRLQNVRGLPSMTKQFR